MKLRVKYLHISTGGPLIVALHEQDALQLGVGALQRVRLQSGRRSQIVVVDVMRGAHSPVRPGEVGLFLEVVCKFGVANKSMTSVLLEDKPLSLQYIKEKLDGKTLSKAKLFTIVRDLVANELAEVEASYFIAGCYTNGMTLDESAYLAQAIVSCAQQLHLTKRIVVDKHCVGGVAGNRTTPIVVAILASLGLTIPKTSTRSITSPAGTADTVEVFCPVAHDVATIKRIVVATGGCMVWGGALGLASADDLLIKLERPLSLDPEGILLASIMAKKAAVGSTHVLVDIPVGRQAKIKSRKAADRLGKLFVRLGKKMKIKVAIMVSDGRQPIGHGIGPVLEARDVLLVLQGNGPADLRAKSLAMAEKIVAMTGRKHAKKLVTGALDSGAAYAKFRQIVAAQGGNPNVTPYTLPYGSCTWDVVARRSGKVSSINMQQIVQYAKLAGSPKDAGAGVDCHVKLGQKVRRGDVLLTVYAKRRKKLGFVKDIFDNRCVVIS